MIEARTRRDAHRGTLFLTKFLADAALNRSCCNFYKTDSSCRIGAQEDKKVLSTRGLCATNRKLEEEIPKWNFSRGFVLSHQRCHISLPPLRDRRGDILSWPTISWISTIAIQLPAKACLLSCAVLEKYHWPGNIRELENLIKRYVIWQRTHHHDLVAREPQYLVQK